MFTTEDSVLAPAKVGPGKAGKTAGKSSEEGKRRVARFGKRLATRDRVLHAATGLFAAKGFRGTCVREIAQRARVNEVTVFRLFRSKKDLYLKVFEDKVGPEIPGWITPLLRSAAEDEATFGAVAENLQRMLDPIFTRLLFFAALENPELVRRSLQPRIQKFYELLGDYIEERVQKGALRALEPKVTAQALVGLIFYQRIFNDLIVGQPSSEKELEKQLRCYIDIWLNGVRPPGTLPRQPEWS